MDSEEDGIEQQQESSAETQPVGIGPRLRAAREEKRLELSHIAAETRIPIRHLQAIESGNFAALPSRTYAIGFSKTYARAVGMDVDATADDVRAELADGESPVSVIAGGMEPGDPAKVPSSGLAWFGAIAAILLLVGGYFFYSTYYGAGSPLASLISPDDATDADADEGALDAEQSAQANQAPDTGDQVVFTATGEVWVRFTENGGERFFQGVMQEGDTFEVPLDAQDPRLNTGRPNLLAITIGGQSVPLIAEETISVSNEPVSAQALLARGEEASDSD